MKFSYIGWIPWWLINRANTVVALKFILEKCQGIVVLALLNVLDYPHVSILF